MTQEEEKEVIRVCGPNYEYQDIPTYIRNRENKKSECCGARMLEGGQCETCGSNGKFEEEMHQVEAEDRMAEELEDKRFAEKSEIDAIRESEN